MKRRQDHKALPGKRWSVLRFLFTAAMLGGTALGTAGRVAGAQIPGGTLRGVVLGTGPQGETFTLSGATLTLTGITPGAPSFRAFADDNGEYQFSNVPAGTYTLGAGFQGFTAASRKVTIATGAAVVENLHLAFATLHQQVEVHAQAPKITQVTAPPATLSAPQLLIVPTAEQKLQEKLPHLAGVVRTQNAKIHIKGVSETQGLLLLDSAEAVDPVTGTFAIDVPLEAIESLDVYRSPFRTQYGGFTGGLTTIQTRPPSSEWSLVMRDINPSIRGKQGHWVGFSRAEPRLYFTGPLWKNKLNFSEAFMYEMRKQSVRGLAWPHDETKTQGFNSFTTFQYIVSPRQLLTAHVHLFPLRQQFANLNALLPQSAATDRGQKGYSVEVAHQYELASGGNFASLFKVMDFNTNSHGQGVQDMLLTPLGTGGNYFNAWTRFSRQEQGRSTYEFPQLKFWGEHRIEAGGEFVHRAYHGISESHPVRVLRTDGSLAEQIGFTGPGRLAAQDTQVSAFVQDHWSLYNRLAMDLGLRYAGQTIGGWNDFDPRLGLVYALDHDSKTVFRGGVGVFHDRLPLLAADFTNNPERVVQDFDPAGNPLAPPLTFLNLCAQRQKSGFHVLSSCTGMDSIPYNLTWRLEVARELTGKMSLQISYMNSRTFDVFIADPTVLAGTGPALLLSNRGSSRYSEYEADLHYRPKSGADLTVSYIHSRVHGDLNTLSQIFVPFELPVIRPNLYSNLSSDVPDRVTALGTFKLPWEVSLSTAVDLHSGFPYSNVDVLDNYVGAPNSLRYPTFFSLDWRVYKDFPLPFHIHKGHKFRFGIYSINTTGRQNPTAVYNNITSPLFGTFTGLGKRVDGIVISFSQ
jgi:Carboxypeptidase regulatory-like domain